MRRHLFTVVSGLSLLMCMAAVGLCVRSYGRCDGLVLYDGDRRTFQVVAATRGRIELVVARTERILDKDLPAAHLVHESDSPYAMSPLPHQFLRLGWGQAASVPPWFSRPAVSVLLGTLAAAGSLSFIIWATRVNRRLWIGKKSSSVRRFLSPSAPSPVFRLRSPSHRNDFFAGRSALSGCGWLE